MVTTKKLLEVAALMVICAQALEQAVALAVDDAAALAKPCARVTVLTLDTELAKALAEALASLEVVSSVLETSAAALASTWVELPVTVLGSLLITSWFWVSARSKSDYIVFIIISAFSSRA